MLAMKNVLVKSFGFDDAHIKHLIDAPGSPIMPTGANIKAALDRIVYKAKARDILFFHYNGHGTRIPSMKHGHPFKQDELEFLRTKSTKLLYADLDLRQLVNHLSEGLSFMILLDSCHNECLIDKEKEQIGPSSITKNEKQPLSYKSKTIPFKYNKLDSMSSKLDKSILLSGFQANETSVDMSESEGGRKASGAFSNAMQMVLKENLGLLSNKEVVMMAKKVLQA
ncbi:hypothetical protein SLEP1_g53549 [Rubroshorea leprosula]|uniref:Peptidase C14 caspase domain-containing protein n=1 Tax=Rubroshorea leprosula TaxID=152421 RepID=A0AAV5MAV5_9ROSI|nr:hypothetical protein SLEP1_g53549 [Rubroshorea leprosula]